MVIRHGCHGRRHHSGADQGEPGKIPPADPVVANPPKLLDALKGQQPRLLFTAKDIEAIKAWIPSDPVYRDLVPEFRAE